MEARQGGVRSAPVGACLMDKVGGSVETTNSFEIAEKKLKGLQAKIEKTADVLQQIAAVPDKVKIRVAPGSITFKVEDDTVSFKALVDEIKGKFRVSLAKDFNDTKGNYFLHAVCDGVKIKIVDIPAPAGCEVRMREVQVIKKKKEFLPFGVCEAIVK
jgi:hypothetical protein